MATTYASLAVVKAFLPASEYEAELPCQAADAEALIRDAEADLDRLLNFNLPRSLTTGRKLDPLTLSVAQVAALERATCLQVAWRIEIGDEALAGIDDDVTGVGGGVSLSTAPQSRPPSPAATEALAHLGFPWRSGYVSPPEPEGAE